MIRNFNIIPNLFCNKLLIGLRTFYSNLKNWKPFHYYDNNLVFLTLSFFFSWKLLSMILIVLVFIIVKIISLKLSTRKTDTHVCELEKLWHIGEFKEKKKGHHRPSGFLVWSGYHLIYSLVKFIKNKFQGNYGHE